MRRTEGGELGEGSGKSLSGDAGITRCSGAAEASALRWSLKRWVFSQFMPLFEARTHALMHGIERRVKPFIAA